MNPDQQGSALPFGQLDLDVDRIRIGNADPDLDQGGQERTPKNMF